MFLEEKIPPEGNVKFPDFLPPADFPLYFLQENINFQKTRLRRISLCISFRKTSEFQRFPASGGFSFVFLSGKCKTFKGFPPHADFPLYSFRKITKFQRFSASGGSSLCIPFRAMPDIPGFPVSGGFSFVFPSGGCPNFEGFRPPVESPL